MDKLQWFKFSYADWRMGKIQRCSEVTQARFINLCCLYWSKNGILSFEDAEIEIDEDHLNTLIRKKVISNTNDFINISFLDEQLNEVEDKTKDKSKSGKIGNLKRWHIGIYKRYENKEITYEEALLLSHTDSNPIATQSQSIADKSRVEKIRVEESREDKIIVKKINNIEDRKLKFSHTLKPFLENYGKDLINDFYLYWTEPNKSNTKFRQELQKTWSLERRLNNWSKNDSKFKGNAGNKNTQQGTSRLERFLNSAKESTD